MDAQVLTIMLADDALVRQHTRQRGRQHARPEPREGFVGLGHGVARAATRVTDERATEMDEVGVLMRRAVDAGEFRRYSDLNRRLHELVRAIGGHRTAEGIITTLHGQLARHQFAVSLLPGRSAVSLPQHERIIQAIRARDPETAEAAMREHIASVIDALRDLARIGLA
jgi:DNA-binding GntR family transcriptional regulator